jgi:UDP-glucose 4-epimerase
MKALITGGAGFVGSHLAEALLARGDEVHVVDNLSTGSIENIEHLKASPRFHYTIDTVLNEPVLAELVDRVDVVFHLAAAVGVRLIVESPVHTIETNVHGTEMVLKLANKKRKKVLLTSTSEVYGKANAVPFREDGDLVMGPTSKGAGATPAARRSTSSSASPTTRRSACRWWWRASSTPWAPARPAATAWWSRAS